MTTMRTRDGVLLKCSMCSEDAELILAPPPGSDERVPICEDCMEDTFRRVVGDSAWTSGQNKTTH